MLNAQAHVRAGRSVLLVSCGLEFGAMCRLHLELEGYRVSAVGAGDGLSLARHDPPDVILLDPDTSLIDGWDLLGELKTDAQLGGIPVMLLTSSVEESDELRALERGAIAFLAKPIAVEDVVAAIRRAVQVRPG